MPNYKSKEEEDIEKVNENRFLALGFSEFAIISTLYVAFFPFSMLFCLFFYGLEDATLLARALTHEFVKTLGVTITVLLLIGFILFLILS